MRLQVSRWLVCFASHLTHGDLVRHTKSSESQGPVVGHLSTSSIPSDCKPIQPTTVVLPFSRDTALVPSSFRPSYQSMFRTFDPFGQPRSFSF
ncbi:hypothetical protein IWX47DRAFT_865382 [Phyllosticta citricarpa]